MKSKDLDALIKKRILQACAKEARSLRKHFDRDGWNIRPVTEQIILDEFGVDCTMAILHKLKNVTYGVADDRALGGRHLVFKLREPRDFAIYDSYTNTIILSRTDAQHPPDGKRYHWLGVV